jgi:hypothetical protein
MKKYLPILISMLVLSSLSSCNKRKLKEVYDNTEETELLLGLWVPPIYLLTPTQEEAEKRYAEIKEAGMVMAYSIHVDPNNMDMLMRSLDAAEKNGIKMLVYLMRYNNEKNLEIVEATKNHPAVLGYNLFDEPEYSEFDNIAQLRDEIKKIVPEDKIIMCNMFPNYATDSVFGPNPNLYESNYNNYLDTYMQKVRPDVLSFDYYPFMKDPKADPDWIAGMLTNLSDIRNIGKKYGVDTWGFVQNSGWSYTRVPNANELRFICHLHLIFGLKSYSYFLYCQPNDKPGTAGIFEGMLTFHGEKTDIYYRVKKQNKDLKKMKGVFLNYDHVGFVTHNMTKKHTDAIAKDLRYDKYKELEKIKSKGSILVGIFEKDGKTGLYVMNFDYKKNNKVTLELDSKTEFKVWGDDGLEQMKKADSIKLKLDPGEGKFIELG